MSQPAALDLAAPRAHLTPVAAPARATPALEALPSPQPPTLPPLRRLPLPITEPPYDDEAGIGPLPRGRGRTPGTLGTQGTLALAFVLPSGVPALPAPVLSLVGAAPADDDDEPRLSGRADLPSPRLWAGRFVQALVEVVSGIRPPNQLVRWTSSEVYADVASRAGGADRSPGTPACRPLVRSIHISEPADGVAEVCGLVQRGERSGAFAVRLEGVEGRWRCTAIAIP